MKLYFVGQYAYILSAVIQQLLLFFCKFTVQHTSIIKQTLVFYPTYTIIMIICRATTESRRYVQISHSSQTTNNLVDAGHGHVFSKICKWSVKCASHRKQHNHNNFRLYLQGCKFVSTWPGVYVACFFSPPSAIIMLVVYALVSV